MAGLMYEVGENYPDVELTIIPGVTAATGGAAVLGAPLIHDFCLISLSDLLTPWGEDRGKASGSSTGGFCGMPFTIRPAENVRIIFRRLVI